MTIEKSKRPSLSEENDAVLASTEEEFLESVQNKTSPVPLEEVEEPIDIYADVPCATVKAPKSTTTPRRRPVPSADDDAVDLGANHAEGSAVKNATGTRPIVFDY